MGKIIEIDQYRQLTPDNLAGQKFIQWYNHGQDHIRKDADGWKTITEYPLSPRKIWNDHQDPTKIIGLRFGKETRTITIDIDRGSAYHPANDEKLFIALQRCLEDIGLCRHVWVRSSHSEGIHVIYPLPREVPTFKAACSVKIALEQGGFLSKLGQLEIFPNTKQYVKQGYSLYNGIRLPLQPESGSYVLDNDLNIISDRVEDFLEMMDTAAAGQDIETFIGGLDSAYKKYKSLNRRGKGNNDNEAVEKWRKDLETTIAQGWTGHGQTNELLTDIQCYAIVFLGLGGSELRKKVKEIALACPGYKQYCRHQREIERRIEEICRNTEKTGYYLPYRNHPERNLTFQQVYHGLKLQNNEPMKKEPEKHKKIEESQKRLTETVIYLQKNDLLPDGLTERRKAIQTTAVELFGKGFSNSTLDKKNYLPLWHPKHQKKAETPKPLREEGLHRISEKPPSSETKLEQSETQTGKDITSDSPLYEGFSDVVSSENSFPEQTTTIPLPPTPFPNAPRPKNSDPDPEENTTGEDRFEASKAKLKKLIDELARKSDLKLAIGDGETPPVPGRSGEIAQQPPRPAPTIVPAEKINPAPTGARADEGPTPKATGTDKEALKEKLTAAGLTINKTIEKFLSSHPPEKLLDALEALKERLERGDVTNPNGFFVQAVKGGWKARSTGTRTENPATGNAAPEKSQPKWLTEEFLTWYQRAIAIGAVEDLPVKYLSNYMNREPMVWVLPPYNTSRFISVPWSQAIDMIF